jgi:hypothetical protein
MREFRDKYLKPGSIVSVRVTDAKEVGMGNPAEKTYRHPDGC